MAVAGEKLFRTTLAVASGERTKGEASGHYQLQIWRDWIQPNPFTSPTPSAAPTPPPLVAPTGAPLPLAPLAPS
eukprot:3700158-Prymnesium_polylepis.1